MFIKMSSGEIFNVILKGDFGAWAISYDEPGAPVLIENEVLSTAERVKAPKEFVDASLSERSLAAEKRYQMIKPLLSDVNCICDAGRRAETAKLIAKAEHTTKERVLRLYYRYLATGSLIDSKPREHKPKAEFDHAIKKYYFSAKRNSLRTTYELMLLDSYSDGQGKLLPDIPSFDAFRMYYHRNWSKNPQKDISRDGLTNYLRNKRPLYGCAMAYRTNIGSYAIDETTADLYVVSSMDRSVVLGRPNIYLAIDIASQLITGVYVGMDAGEDALLKCIANAAFDKGKYCAEMNIKISSSDWPAKGMPSEIISDRGAEFKSGRAAELCLRYGCDLNVNQPFRPDLKALVERNIGLLQDSYKSMLMGKGVIGLDAMERWATDYRQQAVLTLEEYRKIVVLSILAVNKRVIENTAHLPVDAGNTPLSIWSYKTQHGESSLLAADESDICIRALPRSKAKLERRGLLFKKMRYVPAEECSIQIGKPVTFAYDDDNCSCIYVMTEDKGFVKFVLSDSSIRYKGLSLTDVETMNLMANESISECRRVETESKVRLRQSIGEIVTKASAEKEALI